jgi:hypothetical protein
MVQLILVIKNKKDNKFLIIESQRFRYQKFISDLAGQDIRAHNDNIFEAISIVRNFLSNTKMINPSPSIINEDYEKFVNDLPMLCKETNWIVNELTFAEFSFLVTTWLSLNIDKF